jgi:hypothetical protein
MARLTDEELSRVLTAHAVGGLGIFMPSAGLPCCLVQAAKLTTTGTIGYSKRDLRDAAWFDHQYEPTWTVGEFLAQLEARGLA